VSDCLIRNDLKGPKRSRAFLVEGGRGNLFADNVFGGGAEIPRGTGIGQGNIE
jgi:hypothetical protein